MTLLEKFAPYILVILLFAVGTLWYRNHTLENKLEKSQTDYAKCDAYLAVQNEAVANLGKLKIEADKKAAETQKLVAEYREKSGREIEYYKNYNISDICMEGVKQMVEIAPSLTTP